MILNLLFELTSNSSCRGHRRCFCPKPWADSRLDLWQKWVKNKNKIWTKTVRYSKGDQLAFWKHQEAPVATAAGQPAPGSSRTRTLFRNDTCTDPPSTRPSCPIGHWSAKLQSRENLKKTYFSLNSKSKSASLNTNQAARWLWAVALDWTLYCEARRWGRTLDRRSPASSSPRRSRCKSSSTGPGACLRATGSR